MSIFCPVPEEEMGSKFTHYGLAYGLVPVYVGLDTPTQDISVRNWMPEWPLDAAEALYRGFCSFFNLEFDELVLITGEIGARE